MSKIQEPSHFGPVGHKNRETEWGIKQAGEQKIASQVSHRYNHLPLLPSGPGGFIGAGRTGLPPQI
jgi:hypothetical protein